VIAQLFAEKDQKGFDDDVGFLSYRPDAIPKCLEAILHHSWLGDNVKKIIEHGGVKIIIDLYKTILNQPENLQQLVFISRILSNFSMNPDYHKQLFSSCSYILSIDIYMYNFPGSKCCKFSFDQKNYSILVFTLNLILILSVNNSDQWKSNTSYIIIIIIVISSLNEVRT